MSATALIDLRDPASGEMHVIDSNRLRDSVRFELSETGMAVDVMPDDIADCVLSVPMDMLGFRLIRLPAADNAKLREMLRFELDSRLTGGADGTAYDAKALGNDGAGNALILVVYADKSKLEKILTALNSRGLDPKAITSMGLATALRDCGRIDAANPGAESDRIAGIIASARETDARGKMQLALDEIAAPCVNLRQGGLAYTKDAEAVGSRLKMTAAALSILFLVIAAGFSIKTHELNKRSSALQSRLGAVYKNVFSTDAPADPAGLGYKLKARLAEMKTKDMEMRSADALKLLKAVGRAKPAGITYASITDDGNGAVLKGRAASISAVEEARKGLSESLMDVKVAETAQAGREGVLFTITAKGYIGDEAR